MKKLLIILFLLISSASFGATYKESYIIPSTCTGDSRDTATAFANKYGKSWVIFYGSKEAVVTVASDKPLSIIEPTATKTTTTELMNLKDKEIMMVSLKRYMR